MESPPCMHHKISHHENEWSSFIKIFEGERFIFISGIRLYFFRFFLEDFSAFYEWVCQVERIVMSFTF